MSIVTTNLGKVVITPKGSWSSSVTYEKLDLVTSVSGSSYISIADNNINHALSDTDWWQAVANVDNAVQNANDAATLANEKAGLANTAATNADNARLAIQDDLALKANHGYESSPKTLKEIDDSVSQLAGDVKGTTEKPTAQSLSELNARITALEAIISNKIKDRIDVTKEFNVWGKTNLILYGDGASSKTPDFIGQTYIDTTNGDVYIAVGTSNAGNWKLV